MHKIVVLWATPRTTSTAFEWMMRMRRDMICFHEPFGEPWYKGDDARFPRLDETSPRTPGLTRQVVLERLKKAAKQGPIFSKDMPHYIVDMADDAFLDLFTHSFLIRDPAKAIPSIYSRAPEWRVEEFGYKEHRWLFDRVADWQGYAPPVIDSDDLLTDPQGVVEAWCSAVGIPFLPDALSWEPGTRDEVSWYDDGSWHDKLAQSTGLYPQPRTYGTIDDAEAAVRVIYEDALPHYRILYDRRIARV